MHAVFSFVVQECPNYYKAAKLVKYQGKTPTSFAENEGDSISMELINIFLKIRLPFSEWQLAQDEIMRRQYSVIDELTLKRIEKHELMQHIIAKIEPYFHQQDKELGYRNEIQLMLLQRIMGTNISEFISFDKIMTIIGQTLDSYDYTSKSITEELPRSHQVAYHSVCANFDFREYMANKGKDIKEERYVKRWQLMRLIFEINLQDKIDVSYNTIDEFIEKVIQNKHKIPTTYYQYVTDLYKLKRQFGQPTEEGTADGEPSLQYQDPSLLIKRFNEAAQMFYRSYIAQKKDSILQDYLNTKFKNDAANLVRNMIETSAFTDENSNFYTDSDYNGLKTKILRNEIRKESRHLTEQIFECMYLLKKINPKASIYNVSSPIFAQKIKCKTKYDVFVEKYQQLNEYSMFEKGLKGKYQDDRVEFVQALKTENAFSDPENSQFYGNLNYNRLWTIRMKRQFARNAQWAMQFIDELP